MRRSSVELLPKTAQPGNRTLKAGEESRRLLDETIEQLYARPKRQKAREVFVTCQRNCLELNVQPVCERTFYRYLSNPASMPTFIPKQPNPAPAPPSTPSPEKE